jgi:hypothetical protein
MRLSLSVLTTHRARLGASTTYPAIDPKAPRLIISFRGKRYSQVLSNFRPFSSVRRSEESVSRDTMQHLRMARSKSARFQGSPTPSIASAPPA